jgi:hypothetical protein
MYCCSLKAAAITDSDPRLSVYNRYSAICHRLCANPFGGLPCPQSRRLRRVDDDRCQYRSQQVNDHSGESTPASSILQARTANAGPVTEATGGDPPTPGGRGGRKRRLWTRQDALYRTKQTAPNLPANFSGPGNCGTKCLRMAHYVVSSALAEAFLFALRSSLYTQSSKNTG